MTDEHDPDFQAPHEEAVPDHEQPAHEAEAGAYPDDRPPVDDFADAEPSAEDAATVSQETETDMGAGMEENSPPVTGHPRSMLPIVAGVGGLLLLGAVVYWQFGHSSPPPPAVTIAASTQKTPPRMPVRSEAQGSSPSSAGIGESDIDALYKPAATSAAGSAPSETSPTTAMATAPEIVPNSVPATPMGVAMPGGVSSSPTNSGVVAPPPVVAAPQTSQAPPSLVPVSAPASGSMDARFSQMTARLNALQQSLDQESNRLNQITNMVAANQIAPPAAGQTNPALQEQLNRLEQNLMQLQHEEASKRKTKMEAAESSAPAATDYAAAVTKPIAAERKASSSHTMRHKKSKTMAHKAKPAPVKTANVSAAWVLRAATPTEAWVSTDPKSPDLRHIQVGDELPGVGRIMAIRKIGSGWEIEGSSGSVH